MLKMTNVPKIVRDRLQVVSPPPAHPDADVLTAFSERSLTEHEQEVVLEHLARCGDCREIVALALPAQEPVTSTATKSPGRWYTRSLFGWGFVTTGLAAVLLLGFVQYQRHVHSEVATDKAPATPFPTARDERAQEIPASPATVPLPKEESSSENRNSASPPAPVRTYDRLEQFAKLSKAPRPDNAVPPTSNRLSRGTGNLPHGPRQTNQWQQQNANNSTLAYNGTPSVGPGMAVPPAGKQQPASAPSPTAGPRDVKIGASSEVVEVQAQSPAVAADSSQSANGLVVKSEPLPQQTSESGQAETKVDRAKPAMGGAAGEKTLAEDNASPLHGQAMKAGMVAGPRWSISSSGNLQRSFDQGTSWQDVSVNNSYGFAAASSLEVTAARAKAKDLAKAEKKEQAKQPIFRTVVANGTEVWAGGASGLLYHSSDGGLHWNQVALSSAGVVLTGDILSMEFPDAQHGRVSTSTGETWITANGGQTWKKQ